MNSAVAVSEQFHSHILVVDDEPEIAESLVEFLSRHEGYKLSQAGDGQAALAFLETSLSTDEMPVDLVLLDMRMPNMSGSDVLAWIRNHSELRYTRVVLLTAAAGNSEKVEALSAGADDYITKPYYPQELLARVQTILRTQQLERQLQEQSKQLALLNQVNKGVTSKIDSTQSIWETALRGLGEVVPVEGAAALVLRGGRLRYQLLQLGGKFANVGDANGVAPSEGLIGWSLVEKTAVFSNAPREDGRFSANTDVPSSINIRNIMTAPIITGGNRVAGMLILYNKMAGEFSEVDLDLIKSLAGSVSDAMTNAWLMQSVRHRQQEILESRNTLQALIDGIQHQIYTITPNYELISVNMSQAAKAKKTADSFIGKSCYQLFYNRNAPCDRCRVAQTFSNGQAIRWPVKWEGDDHLPQVWDVTAFPIPSRQPGAVIIWQDRTDERRLENSLRQANKLAAIGQLAAGVAHEINNPLTAINANAQMLKMFIAKEDENYEAVDLIARAGERATKVVRGLLDFSRQERYDFVQGDLNKSVKEAIELSQFQFENSAVILHHKLETNLPLIEGSWEHLKSVWINLLVNARDAVLEQDGAKQVEIMTRFSHDKEQIQVLVRDNGKGITEAEMAHIFEPFYTTKDPGKGTGLGLATCHRIIEQHEGEIDLTSKPQEGTTFIIRLPVSKTV